MLLIDVGTVIGLLLMIVIVMMVGQLLLTCWLQVMMMLKMLSVLL